MAGNNYFKFKQFTIVQEKSAMKVGMDGILLGAWVGVNNISRILDIGTGTGLIALMMAQRTKSATIDAIEIDQDAYEEACSNINDSPWQERIRAKHISFQEFAISCTKKYDLIISNPPYFQNTLKLSSKGREKARSNNFLSLDELIGLSKPLLTPKGKLAIIYPFEKIDMVKEIVLENELYINRQTNVKPDKKKKYHRFLVEIELKPEHYVQETIEIRNEKTHSYTGNYWNLTKDFYLNFK